MARDRGVAGDYVNRAFRKTDERAAELPPSVAIRRREAKLRERKQAARELQALQAGRPLKPLDWAKE